MATTVKNANLTVTITDSVTLNGQAYGNTNTLTVAEIDEVYSRVVEVPIGAFTNILQLGTTGQGQVTAANLKYIRVTNLDDTNYINLKMLSNDGDAMVVKVNPGNSFIMGGAQFDANNADISQAAASHGSAFTMSAEATVSPCDIEVFAATI
tara:strand:+ start:148 stop:603 length:456 start_codon:yes stop_codon:yes gene_type:complete